VRLRAGAVRASELTFMSGSDITFAEERGSTAAPRSRACRGSDPLETLGRRGFGGSVKGDPRGGPPPRHFASLARREAHAAREGRGDGKTARARVL